MSLDERGVLLGVHMPFVARKNLRKDREGVASTVGTIMALLVALTFLSVIVNQYVPVWQKESEATHMNTALGQFGNFKSNVDAQILSARVSQASGETYIPVEAYTAIQLGVEGVPVFSNPSNGRLTGSGDVAPWTVQFRYAISGSSFEVNQSAGGNLVLDMPSRYNVPFQLAYESGALIMSQSAGEAVRVDPQFTVLNASSGVEVGLTLVQLIGSGNAAGHGTEGVHSKLITLDPQTYGSFQTSLWINHTTRYGVAWFRHFNETLSLAFGVLPGDFNQTGYNYTETPTGSGQQVTTPYYVLERTQNGTLHTVSLQLVHDPVNGRPLAKLTFNQAYVSIAIGRSGSTLEV